MNDFAHTGKTILLIRIACYHHDKKTYSWATNLLERVANMGKDAVRQGVFTPRKRKRTTRRSGK